MRTVPEAFNARLAGLFGSDYQMYWNETVHRYALRSRSAVGKPVEQFWGWFNRPPDEVTGLHPFRELDATAQEEIVTNLQRSWIGKTGNPRLDWSRYQQGNIRHNRALEAKYRKERAETFTRLIGELDIRRPWLKHHTGSRRSRRVALSAS